MFKKTLKIGDKVRVIKGAWKGSIGIYDGVAPLIFRGAVRVRLNVCSKNYFYSGEIIHIYKKEIKACDQRKCIKCKDRFICLTS